MTNSSLLTMNLPFPKLSSKPISKSFVLSSLTRNRSVEPKNFSNDASRSQLKRKVSESRNSSGKKHANNVGKKWKEYQGLNGWDGLLDPLDDNLRGEILRYGEFVEATYRSFDFNPSSPTYAECKYPKKTLLIRSGVRETGYQVTRNLHATCGVELPSLPLKVPDWILKRSSWIGYVAVCRDTREIVRLGRRDVVIAFRGTCTCMEWIENLRATLAYLQGEDTTSKPMVQSGFLSIYTSKNNAFKSLQETIREEVSRIINMYGEKPLSFTITGHSLGAALATLTAYDIDQTFAKAPIMVTVVSFGGPRVGDMNFRYHLEKSKINILRIVNSDDLVTKVPGFVVDDDDHRELAGNKVTLQLPALLRWFQKLVDDMQWIYADIGQELRFSSKECPYMNKVNIVTCHELKTYLELVSGFVSSKCPYRATKRVLRMYHVK